MLFMWRCKLNSTSSTISKTLKRLLSYNDSTHVKKMGKNNAENFRVLELYSPPRYDKKLSRRKKQSNGIWNVRSEDRYKNMSFRQDWPSVWPTARTFHPATVPLPLRQGFVNENKPFIDKHSNAELMKIPNFLHLTPTAVQRHCEELKKFCTQWPAKLQTKEDCTKHFPVELITSDYCYASPTIREPLARIVSLRVPLSSLRLDTHAKDKILRLVGNRYNAKTDLITITADRCPSRKQNTDYVKYLLTAVYNESLRVEPWEAEKSEADMEYYDWDKSKSRKNIVLINTWPEPPTDFSYENIPYAIQYKNALSDVINVGEDIHSLEKYKCAVKCLLQLGSKK